jgi:DNA helicase-2/ATP-dependent DNA helicase PcrA
MRLDHLNPEQRDAVLTTEGPLLVLAGAGSGKTRVITHRVAHLVAMGIPPEAIVALSFTNKAAGEMRERLLKMVGPDVAGELVLSTFHSLGVRMMRDDPGAFGLPQRFSILDQGDVYGVVRTLLHDFGVNAGERRYDVGAVVQRISLWKNEFLDADGVYARSNAPGSTEYDDAAAAVYEAYDDRLRSLGAVDFDDLVCLIAARLGEDERLKRRWTDQFQYVMVDEYQDTNTAQFSMLRELLTPAENLCVVGDDDQAIYGWRGAKVSNILGFDMVFRNAKVIRLERNYRSRPPILAAANAVVQHNRARHEKTLRATKRGGVPVKVVLCRDGEEETRWIGRQIRRLVRDIGVPADDVAVLYRSARLAGPIEGYLQADGTPYRVLGGQAHTDRKLVRDAIAYLKLIVAPWDDLGLRRAIDTPPRGIGRTTMDHLSRFADAHHLRLSQALRRHSEISALGPRQHAALSRFVGQIDRAMAHARSARQVAPALRQWLDDVGLRAMVLKESGSPEATKRRWEGVEWLLRSVERFESRAGGRPKWADFLGTIALEKQAEDEDAPKEIAGQVTLCTLHSSKGLEWDHVFLIGVEEGTLPHKRVEAARASDAIEGDLDEERRLFYVGITRAKEELRITRAGVRLERGREVEVIPSRFLEELPDDVEHLEPAAEQVSDEKMDAMADAFFAKFSGD